MQREHWSARSMNPPRPLRFSPRASRASAVFRRFLVLSRPEHTAQHFSPSTNWRAPQFWHSPLASH